MSGGPVGSAGQVIAKSAAHSFLVRVMAAAAMLLMHASLARYLGPSEYGVYSYLVAWASLLATVAAFGSETAALKVSSQTAIADRASLWQFFRDSIRHVLLLSVISMVCAAALLMLSPHSATYSTAAIFVGLATIPCVSILSIVCGGVQGLGKPVLAQVLLLVVRPSTVLLCLLAVLLLAEKEGTAILGLLLECGAALAATCVSVWVLARILGRTQGPVTPRQSLQAFLSAGAALLALNLLQVVLVQTGVLVLGAVGRPEEAGLYAVAARFSTTISLALAAINAVVVPVIGRCQRDGDFAGLQKAVATVTKLSTLVALPACGVLALFGKDLLALLGPGFERAYPALLFLTLGQCVNALTGCVIHIMVMNGRQRQAVKVLALPALGAVVISVVVAELWGATGVAVVSALCMATWNLVLAGWIARNLNIKTTLFPFGLGRAIETAGRR